MKTNNPHSNSGGNGRDGSGSGGNWRQVISRLLSMGMSREQITMTGGGEKAESFQREAWIRKLLKDAENNRQELETRLAEMQCIVLDTETTGFRPEHGDEIISVAAVKFVQGGARDEVFSTYVRPSIPIPPVVTELTGISDESVKDAPRLGEVMHDFLQFIGDGTIVGYHIGHDISFLNAYLWKSYRTRLKQRVIELRQVMETLFQRSFVQFDDAVSFFSIPDQGRHTALGDVRMTCDLWDRAVEECHRQNVYTLRDLYVRMNVGA